MDVTTKTHDGKELFKDSKIYMPQATTCRDEKMVYGAHKKVGYIRDTSLQPFKPTEETFEIKLPEDVKTVEVTLELSYQPWPGNVYPIQSVKRSVTLSD